jgi:hypothetical protein
MKQSMDTSMAQKMSIKVSVDAKKLNNLHSPKKFLKPWLRYAFKHFFGVEFSAKCCRFQNVSPF